MKIKIIAKILNGEPVVVEIDSYNLGFDSKEWRKLRSREKQLYVSAYIDNLIDFSFEEVEE